MWENVVARIYDPRRAEIYQRLGIPTVATVGWTAAETLHRMMPERAREEWRDNSGKVALAEFAVDDGWIGTRYSELASRWGRPSRWSTGSGTACSPSRPT